MVDPFIARDERWLLPEGIEELLPDQAEPLERLRRNLLDLFAAWGYRLVIPPIIEHLESLLVGTGRDLELQTFKLTDQLTGRLLGVRADMTPQVARIDAHRLKSNAPARLCYVGPVLHTRPQGFARTRSPFQVGAELYGHDGIDSDAEILQLMVETLAIAGLSSPHIDLGHVGVFRGLAREAQLAPEQEQVLFDALQRKAQPEIEAYLASLAISPEQRRMLTALVDLNGDERVLAEAREALRSAGPAVQQALANLEQIAQLAQRKMPGMRLAFRPGGTARLSLSNRRGVCRLCARPRPGNRARRPLRRHRPRLRRRAARHGLQYRSGDLDHARSPAGGSAGRHLRTQCGRCGLAGRHRRTAAPRQRVCMELPGQSGTAQEMGCDRILERGDGTWQIKTL